MFASLLNSREIAHLPLDERERLLRLARRRAMWDWRSWMWIVPKLALLWFLFSNGLTRRVFMRWPFHGWSFWLTTSIPFGCVACSYWLMWTMRRRLTRRALEAEMFQDGIAPSFCFHCGYDLRATTDRCSECGACIPGRKDAVRSTSKARLPTACLVVVSLAPLLLVAGVLAYCTTLPPWVLPQPSKAAAVRATQQIHRH
jgi:hypothetical protein